MPNYLDRIAGINWLENAPYIYDSLMTKDRMLSDPYTYHGKMTICLEDLYAYVCDLNKTPSAVTGYYRRLDAQAFEIITEFPDLTDTDVAPIQDKAYWLIKDIMDGTEIKYPAGLYIYSLEDNEFTRPYEEDDKLDLDAIFDSTIVAEYEGNKDNFVDGDYLYNTIKDLSRYIKPFHHLTLVDVNTVADMNTYLSTAAADKVYKFTVKEDEEHSVAATDQHDAYDPKTKYIVVAVEKAAREDGTEVPSWNKVFLGTELLDEHPFDIVDVLPDITDEDQKPNRDMTYWLVSNIMDGTEIKYPAGIYIYDFSKNTLERPYEEKKIDLNFILEGIEGENEKYAGDDSKFVSSKYLAEALDDYSRWIRPLYNIQYLDQVIATKAELDAIDMDTKETGATYVAFVEADETSASTVSRLKKAERLSSKVIYDCTGESIDKNIAFGNNGIIVAEDEIDGQDIIIANDLTSTEGWLYHNVTVASAGVLNAETKEQVTIEIETIYPRTVYIYINNEPDDSGKPIEDRTWKFLSVDKDQAEALTEAATTMLEILD